MNASSRHLAAEAVWTLIVQRVHAGAYDSYTPDDLARRLAIASRYAGMAQAQGRSVRERVRAAVAGVFSITHGLNRRFFARR